VGRADSGFPTDKTGMTVKIQICMKCLARLSRKALALSRLAESATLHETLHFSIAH
jgi:hypothetical protein